MSKYAARSVLAVKSYFAEKLNARLPAVGKDMGLVIPDVRTFLIGEWWDHTEALYCFTYADEQTPHIIGNGQRAGSYDTAINLALRYKMSAQYDKDVLKVLGYGTAITELLDARDLGHPSPIGDPTLGGRVSVCILERIEYGSLALSADKSITAYGLVASLTVRVHEGVST